MTEFAMWIVEHWVAIAAVGVLGGVIGAWGLAMPHLLGRRR